MLNFLGKILLMITLVCSSVDVCFPNDIGCVETISAKVDVNSQSNSHDNSTSEQHHCFCSISCHVMYFNFISHSSRLSPITKDSLSFDYIQIYYPQVFLSLDKPPIV